MTAAVYIIENARNGHRYIGSAIDVARRWREHRSELRRGVHHSPCLQRAWNKHGEDSFRFRVVQECSPETLIGVEQRFLDAVAPEYNSCKIAGSQLGRRRTDEARAKMAAAWTAERRARLAEANRQREWSAESRAKDAAPHIGKRASPETRAKMAIANTGRKHTPEAKAKMSAAKKVYWAKKK